MREKNLQDACIKYCKSKNIYCINIHGGGWGAKGAPDLITCINGKFVAFELKVGDNELQPDQRIHRRRILRNGGQHYCPRTLDEFVTIVEEVEYERDKNIM